MSCRNQGLKGPEVAFTSPRPSCSPSLSAQCLASSWCDFTPCCRRMATGNPHSYFPSLATLVERENFFPHGNHTEWLVPLFFTFLYCMNFSHGILFNKFFNMLLKNQSYQHQYKKLHGQTIIYLALPLVVELLSRVWLCDPTDCDPWGTSVHGILQARILEGVTISFSRGSSRNWTCVPA